ncbi:uncharacterized protein SCHCODRAFT_02497764 [Schizophyllum commune H4-8]|nr:uncharacterized protein SCHCODRAFT_02497764 [Schizophyllum commune H4-8]KAI5895288.1 hypothetical protein SCHCODRAFT_02497764 [Schizophyllum commune H4-8]
MIGPTCEVESEFRLLPVQLTPLRALVSVGMASAYSPSTTLVNSSDPWVSAVPVEIWENIFREADREGLLEILLVCKGFHLVGKGVFYRNLRWSQPQKILDAPGELLSRGIPLQAPRSLVLSVHLVDPHQVAVHEWLPLARTRVVGLDGSFVPLDDRIPQQGFAHLMHNFGVTIDRTDHASLPLYRKILTDVIHLPRLNHLSLQNAHLPREVYSTIATLHELQTLDFVKCTLPFALASAFPTRFLNLPIESLTIDRTLLRRGSRAQEATVFTIHDPLVHPLFMATAHNLASLTTGWKESFIRILGQKASYPSLRHLHVGFLWDSANSSGPLVLTNFPRFLAYCPGLRSLEIASPARDSQMSTVDLPALERFEGPMSLARAISAPVLDELVLSDIRSVDSEALLEFVHALPRTIQLLSAKVDKWDVQLLPTLADCVPRLRTLHITYLNHDGRPSAQYLNNMGDAHLVRFRQLHTLRIYMAMSELGRTASELALKSNTKELACRWSIPCESLRIVQLSESSVWALDTQLHDWQEITSP